MCTHLSISGTSSNGGFSGMGIVLSTTMPIVASVVQIYLFSVIIVCRIVLHHKRSVESSDCSNATSSFHSL